MNGAKTFPQVRHTQADCGAPVFCRERAGCFAFAYCVNGYYHYGKFYEIQRLLPPPRERGLCDSWHLFVFISFLLAKLFYDQILMNYLGNIDNGTRKG